MAIIEIDTHSGFCLGVVNAIKKAEDFLEGHDTLYSLGDIVHNNKEVERLESKGMKTITREQMLEMHHTDILFRAHGEPPVTYEKAKELGLRLIDATCPVVLSLQAKVRIKYKELKDTDTQLVLFGKKGHAEVIGLLGQTENTAIVLEDLSDAGLLDFSKPIVLFSQTTKSLEEFQALVSLLRTSMNPGVPFEYHDTICRQVANRMPLIRDFAKRHDCILFVSGAKSSNGKALYDACHSENARTFFITGPDDVLPFMFSESDRIGICGATSTPVWLMEDVKKQVEKLLSV
ncbi:MAG: 4-hydroxy-3-methylbut-2-enyl diphosphate reductase [Bacteroidales bacterium]|nr:4-hydroxy-3-methylbut-2-enyl diphosphate reductase [Bacteroidales bacterium]MDD4713265.1 4-hydroxy-3-methylbut-2-enyl diphosphate reductase [Bacteroidales bacterium]